MKRQWISAMACGALLAVACNDGAPLREAAGAERLDGPRPHCEFPLGRMTGGGGQLTIGDVYVTRGFTLHCDITLSNNLEVNWPGNKWHLDKPIEYAECTDQPDVNPEPPPAPFDTFYGEAVGSLNGVDGARIQFQFQDAGEPGGRNDRAWIKIFDPAGNLVLDVPWSYLDHGNLQAHYDQPHGSNVNQ